MLLLQETCMLVNVACRLIVAITACYVYYSCNMHSTCECAWYCWYASNMHATHIMYKVRYMLLHMFHVYHAYYVFFKIERVYISGGSRNFQRGFQFYRNISNFER